MTSTNLPRAQQAELENRLAECAEAGVDGINARLAKIEREWSSGRIAKATTGIAIVIGFALAALHDPLWLLLPAIAGAFMLQHIFIRSSILTEGFQALGWRSGHAIENERFGLRTLRGDFRHLPTVAEVEEKKDAVCRMQDEGGPAMDDDDAHYGAREVAVIIAATAD